MGGGQREGHGARIWPNKHKMELISEYLDADTSPDASADALAIINIGYFTVFEFLKVVLFLTVCFKVFTKEFLEECFGNFQGFFRSVSMEIQRSF